MSERRNKGWQNLKTEENSFALYDRDRLREVSRKGAEASHKARAEKKSARQALEKILTMNVTDQIVNGAELSPELAEQLKAEFPDATLYDLLQLVAVGNALGGDMRAVEYVRDTCGDKPSNKIDMQTENAPLSEADRMLLEKVSRRLDNPDLYIAVDATQENC